MRRENKYANDDFYRANRDIIPAINFPSDWDVKIIPPLGGALIRFLVVNEGIHVSVYLDADDSLGFVGSPYWEVYPVDSDVERFDINDVSGLLSSIAKSIRQQVGDLSSDKQSQGGE